MNKPEIAVCWFRRDLRLDDNCALYHALKSDYSVLPLFIFDDEILDELPKNDIRVSFIHSTLEKINETLKSIGSSLYIKKGSVQTIWNSLFTEFNIKEVYFNKDYEPYAIKRDFAVKNICKKNNCAVFTFKDQVIFEENDILKQDNSPYTVFTPYKNKWFNQFSQVQVTVYPSENLYANFFKAIFLFPTLQNIGFVKSKIQIQVYNLNVVKNYQKTRNFPTKETSHVSVYLRFGLISIRKLVKQSILVNQTFVSELIWREFFMQILFHFPQVVSQDFKEQYNFIQYRNNETEFKLWCEGKTGYPIVDAGMRELNATGFMHNRVRMVVASFLIKHLLIDWHWGEAYFAQKLLDYELSSNNGNWQWVAGTGCDAAPYYRVFNPISQQEKFDPNFEYIKKWNPNYKSIPPIVDHKIARERYFNAMKNIQKIKE